MKKDTHEKPAYTPKSEVKQQPPNNPLHTNDKIPINIPQFTLNIPLEADEHLTLTTVGNNNTSEIEEFNPIKIMMDKRTLLKSQPTPPIATSVSGTADHNVVVHHKAQVDNGDAGVDEAIERHDGDDHLRISHTNYPVTNIDERSNTNSTCYYVPPSAGALPTTSGGGGGGGSSSRAPEHYYATNNVNDNVHYMYEMGHNNNNNSIPTNTNKRTLNNDYNMINHRPHHNYPNNPNMNNNNMNNNMDCCSAYNMNMNNNMDCCSPYPLTNEPPQTMVCDYPPDDHHSRSTRCDYPPDDHHARSTRCDYPPEGYHSCSRCDYPLDDHHSRSSRCDYQSLPPPPPHDDHRSRCDYMPIPPPTTMDDKNYHCYMAAQQSNIKHSLPPTIYEYENEYQQHQAAVNYYQNNNPILSNPASPSSSNHPNKPYDNYNKQINFPPPMNKHIKVEKVIDITSNKDDLYDPDSTDTFVEQIAKIYITERPTPRDQEKTKPCNCQKTGCLKLYCECFARGDSCFNCSCKCCLNTSTDYEHWLKASNLVKSRRKTLLAMSPRNHYENKLRRGCNCRRSLCLKKYCECYDKQIPCTKYCRCIDCCNGYDSQHVRKVPKSAKKEQPNPVVVVLSGGGGGGGGGGETSTPSRITTTSHTDTNPPVFYSDVHSSEPGPEPSTRHRHHHQGEVNIHGGSHRGPVNQLHHNRGVNLGQCYPIKLHASQSSNDLINRPVNNIYQKLPRDLPYTKSSSTPNLLTAYSIHKPRGGVGGGGGVPGEYSSSSKRRDRSYTSDINNKQVMNQYLSLIARNPDHNE